MKLLRYFLLPVAIAAGAAGAFAQAARDSAQVQRDNANIKQEQGEIQKDWQADKNDTRLLGKDKQHMEDLRLDHAADEQRLERDRKKGDTKAIQADEARLREQERQMKALTEHETRTTRDDAAKREDVTGERKELREESQKRDKDAAGTR